MSEEQPKKAEKKFSNFLWSRIDMIDKARDKGDHLLALQRTIRLIDYLPTPVKEKFKPKAKNMREELRRKVKAVKEVDDYLTLMRRSSYAQRMASVFVEELVDELMTELYDRGYLEKKGGIFEE